MENLSYYSTLVLILMIMMEELNAAIASEWSLGPTDEYVEAFLNVSYKYQDAEKFRSEKQKVGKFGAGRVAPAYGVVVHVFSVDKPDVHYGCDFPFGNIIPNEPWIALIKRGVCNFDKKLENAYRSNASAMVVYDREEKDTLERMGLKNCNNCDIPGVFTFKWKGEEIVNLLEEDAIVFMHITVGEAFTRPYSGINRTSVLFVSISFIVLMIISLAWLVFYYVQRFRYLHAKDRLAQRLCNAAKKALAKIPTRNIKLTDKEINGEGDERAICAVCIEFYRPLDIVRTLPCKHEFHKLCVDPWLLEHRTCPMCKMDILKYYGFIQFTGSQESILHLEDGINSSDSRESPNHDPSAAPPIILTGNSHQAIAQIDHEAPRSSTHSLQRNSIRKPSLISLTVGPGAITRSTGECSPTSEGDGSVGEKRESIPNSLHHRKSSSAGIKEILEQMVSSSPIKDQQQQQQSKTLLMEDKAKSQNQSEEILSTSVQTASLNEELQGAEPNAITNNANHPQIVSSDESLKSKTTSPSTTSKNSFTLIPPNLFDFDPPSGPPPNTNCLNEVRSTSTESKTQSQSDPEINT